MISPSQKPLPTQDNTTYKHKRQNIHAPSGIRTRNSSNKAAADQRLIPRGYWDQHTIAYHYFISSINYINITAFTVTYATGSFYVANYSECFGDIVCLTTSTFDTYMNVSPL
jgi:hypothetical protein